jgi:2-aminoadipate transaminase
MISGLHLDPEGDSPLYRQIADQIRGSIESGQLTRGERLPPIRELAVSLGLNRNTIAAAYEQLQTDGLVYQQVGKGTFVRGTAGSPTDGPRPLDWDSLLKESPAMVTAEPARLSFAASRPSEHLFPIEEFRSTCREVIESDEAASILQLGSAAGYAPLRRYLLEQARERGEAGPEDDILITSGCQQALDLLQRVLAARGEAVVLEDPVYPGLRNVFQTGSARVLAFPVEFSGWDLNALAALLERERPRLIVVTPDFQNPTGLTMPEATRRAVLDLARRQQVVLVENSLYSALRYRGADVPSIKQIDAGGSTVLLGSFSKIAFPGLRVGWVIAPRPLIARLTEAKQVCDLHSDQLSQAVLLKFAESGRLGAHLARMLDHGRERLDATLAACEDLLPEGSVWTRPEGGMNVWVRLPAGVDTESLLPKAVEAGVSFLPGRLFGVARAEHRALRLSFAGLKPEEIRRGIGIVGELIGREMDRQRGLREFDPAPALV